jgi:YaiO family outer membrane protein
LHPSPVRHRRRRGGSTLSEILFDLMLVRPRAVLSAALAAVCLLATPAPAGAQSLDTTVAARRAVAERLRREERFPEALAAYQTIAASEAGTREDRFWVAKLESWTGRLAEAEADFVRLLEERPDDEDSRLALAAVRRWRADPSAAPWEAGVEYYGEHVDGQPSTHGATLAMADHSGRFRWRGAVTVQDKFARTESRAGVEPSFRLSGRFVLRGLVFTAPGAEVLPRGTYGAGVASTLGHLVLGADYAFFDYRDAEVHQVGPTAEVYLGSHWLAAARYRYSSTSFSLGGPAVGNHGGSFTLGYLYGPANLVRVFGGVGGESFAGPSRELVGSFDAVTVGFGWRHYLGPRLGLELAYARQDRSTELTQDSWSVGLVQRW